MIIDNHPISELGTEMLKRLLEEVKIELDNREKGNREDAMNQLWQLIEKIQAKKYDIILIDSEDREIEVNDICSVYDTKYNFGATFSLGKDGQEYFDEFNKMTDRIEIKYDEDGEVVCIHKDDRVDCPHCEIKDICWK